MAGSKKKQLAFLLHLQLLSDQARETTIEETEP